MLHGVEALLSESKQFFAKLSEYLQGQIELLEANAQADSRFISAFLDRIAKANIDRTLERMDAHFEKPSKPKLTNDELLIKLRNNVQRALEFLEEHNSNVQKGAYFIPVPFHKSQAIITQGIVDECKKLLEKFPLENANSNNKKSWSALFTDMATKLITVRTLAFGLDKNPRFGLPSTQIEKMRIDALAQLAQTCQELNEINSTSRTLTNVSKRMLGCDSYQDQPKQPICYQYCPDNIPAVMKGFAEFMQATPQEQLTKAAVHEKVHTEFPRPIRK